MIDAGQIGLAGGGAALDDALGDSLEWRFSWQRGCNQCVDYQVTKLHRQIRHRLRVPFDLPHHPAS
jgi:hypothetical protein